MISQSSLLAEEQFPSPTARFLNFGKWRSRLLAPVGILAVGLATASAQTTLTYTSGTVTAAGSYTNPDVIPNTVAPSSTTDVILNSSSGTYDLNNADLVLQSLGVTNVTSGYGVLTGPTGSLETINNVSVNLNGNTDIVRFRGLTSSAFQFLDIGGNLVLTRGILELGNRSASNQQREIGNITVGGSTQIASNATLRLADAIGSISFGSYTVNASLGNLAMSGGAFDLVSGSSVANGIPDGGTNTVGVTQLSGSGTISGAKIGATLATTGHLIVNGSISSSFTGTISNGLTNNVIALTKDGSSTLTLTGNNTYTGQTTITAGTVLLSGAGSIGSTTIGFGVTNSASGQLQIENSFTFDDNLFFSLSGVTVSNASWNLFDGSGFSSSTLTGLSSVNSDLGAFSFSSGTWNLIDGGRTWSFDGASGQLTAIPEPATWALTIIALCTVTLLRRRRRA